MKTTTVLGVDPGLVHTGLVLMQFEPSLKRITVEHEAVAGIKPDVTSDWIDSHPTMLPDETFIEGYRPRSHLNSDALMVAGVSELRKELKATVLMNTGVKKVVKRPLMELLGVWSFATPTHHQDLRSAARIALLGMLKHEPFNRLLTQVVQDHLAGRTWSVR